MFLSIPSARYTDKADGPAGSLDGSAPGTRSVLTEKGGRQAVPRLCLTRIEFDDQRLVDVRTEFVAVRRLLEGAFHLGGAHLHPRRQADRFGELQRVDDAQLLLRLFADGYHVAGLDQVRRDVDDLAVDRDRLVRHQLARFGARAAEAHAIDDVVQARLQQRQQVRAGVALAALGFGEVAAELALQHAVHALDLLLLAQLQAEVAGA